MRPNLININFDISSFIIIYHHLLRFITIYYHLSPFKIIYHQPINSFFDSFFDSFGIYHRTSKFIQWSLYPKLQQSGITLMMIYYLMKYFVPSRDITIVFTIIVAFVFVLFMFICIICAYLCLFVLICAYLCLFVLICAYLCLYIDKQKW
jgi:hypothetical protein